MQCTQEKQHDIYQGQEEDKNEDTLPHDAVIEQQQMLVSYSVYYINATIILLLVHKNVCNKKKQL